MSNDIKRFFTLFIILSLIAFFLNKIQFMLFTVPYGSVFGFDYLFQIYFETYRHPYFSEIFLVVFAPNILLFILMYKISIFLHKRYIFYTSILIIWFMNSYFNLYVFIDEKFKSLFTVPILYLIVVIPFMIIVFWKKQETNKKGTRRL